MRIEENSEERVLEAVDMQYPNQGRNLRYYADG